MTQELDSPSARPSLSGRLAGTALRLTAPRGDGLPNVLVLTWFPGVLLVLVLVAVVLEVSGSSTGTFWHVFHGGNDPHLLTGEARSIRSDEWLVQGSWLVSQSAQGFPAVNHVFPGGMNATVLNDAPSWDWSTFFRPHLWGSLVLGLDRGMAWRWWLPAWLLMSSIYVFVVSVLPRRVLLGVLLAVAVLFQPMIQWWWMPANMAPIPFAFATMTAVVWGLRAGSTRARVLPAVAAGFLAVDMGMSMYVPFMLAVLYPTLAYTAGAVLLAWRSGALTPRDIARRALPLVCAAGAAGLVMAVWAWTRRSTLDSLLSTAYPGQRLYPTGTGNEQDLVSLLSGPFQRALTYNHFSGLGTNQSTASVPLLVSVFLIVPMVWLVRERWRRTHAVDWVVAAIIAVHLFVLAFIYLPGWNALAHLLLVDRSHALRIRLAFVVLIGVSVVVLVEHLAELRARAPWLASGLAGCAVVAASAWVGHRLAEVDSPVVPSASSVVVTGAFAIAVVLLARRHVTAGAALLTACSVVIGIGANPLYRGVFDVTTDTRAGRAVAEIASTNPEARWVGVGGWISMGTLFEAAVPAYSGVQSYPSKPMWDQIDPSHAHEFNWNRLAHIHWVDGTGDPDPRQPANGSVDVIEVTFDSCAPFAQQYVTYVLADGAPLHQPCLERLEAFKQGAVREQIYRVTRK